MIRFKHTLFLLALSLLSMNASAASGMEEYFYASGKIKVVIGVVTIVLVGIFAFLFRLERRVKELENKK
jgi:hypothetical protein